MLVEFIRRGILVLEISIFMSQHVVFILNRVGKTIFNVPFYEMDHEKRYKMEEIW